MQKLIIATGNAGKLKEFKDMLSGKFDVLGLKDIGYLPKCEENGKTFEENAFIKADEVYKITGENVLADDSGLCVFALNGAPGVYSARYAGEHATANECNELLLKNLDGITDRRAYFECCLAFIRSNGERISTFGRTDGEILLKPQGTDGFGYDPLFYSDDLKKSFGIASEQEKNAVSHRGRALRELVKKI